MSFQVQMNGPRYYAVVTNTRGAEVVQALRYIKTRAQHIFYDDVGRRVILASDVLHLEEVPNLEAGAAVLVKVIPLAS